MKNHNARSSTASLEHVSRHILVGLLIGTLSLPGCMSLSESSSAPRKMAPTLSNGGVKSESVLQTEAEKPTESADEKQRFAMAGASAEGSPRLRPPSASSAVSAKPSADNRLRPIGQPPSKEKKSKSRPSHSRRRAALKGRGLFLSGSGQGGGGSAGGESGGGRGPMAKADERGAPHDAQLDQENGRYESDKDLNSRHDMAPRLERLVRQRKMLPLPIKSIQDHKVNAGKAQNPTLRLKEERPADAAAFRDRKDRDLTDAMTSRPTKFLPRMCYFENTYLGGNAAYRERLRRLSKELSGAGNAWMKARAAVAEIDPPSHAGIGLSATLDQRSLETGRRVWLQVGLRGSRRYGWRRPPLDVAVVVTPDAIAHPSACARALDTLRQLVRRLGPRDRVEVRVVSPQGGTVVQAPINAAELRHRLPALVDKIEAFRGAAGSSSAGLRASLAAAGVSLVALSDNPHRVPGTRLVLLVTGQGDPRAAELAERAAHDLQLRGAVTSVLAVASASDAAGWWRVANAGHGNFHRVAEATAADAVQAELDALSRVVARLLRLNIRLGRDANAVRILGSKVLKRREVARVKEREKRIDNALSASMGVTADRGDDDDGIQTVIPYFYGDDSHVLLVELWVDKPGAVADITLRYKDLVNLKNATERISVSLSPGVRPATPAQREVVRNVRATRLALALGDAWRATAQGNNFLAVPALKRAEKAAKNLDDQHLVRGLRKLVLDNLHAPVARQQAVREALRMARDRKVGDAGR